MMREGVKTRVGYFKEGRRWMLHVGRKRETDARGKFVPKYTGAYFMDLIDTLGLPPGPLVPTLPVSGDERSRAAAFLAERKLARGPLVILAPGAAFGPSKLWPAERFAAVGDALRKEGASVLIEVNDHGPGIAETEREQIFQAFVSSKPNGLGFGLALSKTLVESHGGRISVSNNVEGGACFRVLLPAAS